MTPPAFPDVYRRYFPIVHAKCRRMLGTGAAADDAVQEAFVRLWRSGPVDADARTLTAWLYRTSTRLAIDSLRERRHASDDGLQHLPCGAGEGPDDALAARKAIFELAASVPDDELEAALLARVDGLSQPEVATLLGVTDRTVRRLLERFDQRTAELRRGLLS